MIKNYERFFGAVFTRMATHSDDGVNILKFPSKSNASFVVNNQFGLYIKYSSSRLSPWQFSFAKEHQDEILEMRGYFEHVFVIFVCNDNGIACLNFEELKQILDEHHQDTEWIRVSRNKREKYSVAGTDGKLNFKIGDSDFPKKVLDKNY